MLDVTNVAFLTKGPYSFSVAAGECVGLSGRSGIGKTQLLRAMADLIPCTGNVVLNGIDAQKIPAPRWRQMVGMVPADPQWWFDLVGDHFPKNEQMDTLLPTLERLGFAMDVLNWEVSRLSTGERQRLALIRALVPEPIVLLLDEPSSALDATHTNSLEELLAELRQSKELGIVWVSHDPAQLRRVANRIFTLEEHTLLEIVTNRTNMLPERLSQA
ncbi:ABC transporter ATP-binding protein [Desulfopila aestuarii]|uniref:ABC transporter ATP-binding protein n=1 Tax=Desulfopila aestuarii TaxID=231440 RepID=UPI001F2F311A|nr:ATP-binding cassette domain-containing protein [Desulfopila aestuarii]